MVTKSVVKMLLTLIICFCLAWPISCIVTSRTMSYSKYNREKSRLENKIREIDGRIAVIDAEIARHRNNIRSMQAILAEAQRNHTQPDVSRLHHAATATGQRTEAYHEKPPWLQAMIDKFESKGPIGASASLCFISMMGGTGRAHYLMEIGRSNQFINMLETERNRLIHERDQAFQSLVELSPPPGHPDDSADDTQMGGY